MQGNHVDTILPPPTPFPTHPIPILLLNIQYFPILIVLNLLICLPVHSNLLSSILLILLSFLLIPSNVQTNDPTTSMILQGLEWRHHIVWGIFCKCCVECHNRIIELTCHNIGVSLQNCIWWKTTFCLWSLISCSLLCRHSTFSSKNLCKSKVWRPTHMGGALQNH